MRSSFVLPSTGRHLLVLGGATAVLLGALGPFPTHVSAAGAGSITGTVYQDLNRDGTFDSGDVPFTNLRVDLLDSSGVNVAAANTDSAGTYQFSGLSDGSYVVMPDASAWTGYSDSWVMTNVPAPAPGYLTPKIAVSLAGSGTADFALRPIVRSTTVPITSYRAPDGMLVQSYDDVVPAEALYNQLQQGQFLGSAASSYTTINFDLGVNPNVTTFSCVGSPGAYTSYTAVTSLAYASWRDQFDDLLFHEHGHEWSLYTACLVQQDMTLDGYLQARGLLGNPLVGSSYAWDPKEILAEDYRQLFGTANAASYAQMNLQIPPAAQVPGLKDWLEYTFTTPASSAIPAPSVTSVSPDASAATGGAQVTITGSNFTGPGFQPATVSFGGRAASFTVVSPSQITATAPAGSGIVNVTVTTQSSGGIVMTSAVTGADAFAYVPAPTVTSISPASGSRRGGTTVTLTGLGFEGSGFTVTAVHFGGSAVASFTVLSPTSIVAVAPAGSTGSAVQVTVTTAAGTSPPCTACTFTYTRH